VGIIPLEDALNLAKEQHRDLVCVAPQSTPPVCRIMDYGKFKYEISKRERDAKKKQHTDRMKEIKIRPRIDDNDYGVKLRKAVGFLQKGFKLRLTLMFRGREMAHQELGYQTLARLIEDLKEHGTLETDYRKMGRRVTCLINPSPAGKTSKKAKKEGVEDAQAENQQGSAEALQSD